MKRYLVTLVFFMILSSCSTESTSRAYVISKSQIDLEEEAISVDSAEIQNAMPAKEP